MQRRKLDQTGLVDTILEQTAERSKPLLGICLGMQLLFEESHEYGVHKGLGLIKGTIASIDADLKKAGIEGLKVPHIGWNAFCSLMRTNRCSATTSRATMYAFTAFAGRTAGKHHRNIGVRCDHHGRGAQRQVYGTQFHPEKSGEVGLKMLEAFMEV